MDIGEQKQLIKTIDLYLKNNAIIVNSEGKLESGTWSSYFQSCFEWAGLRDRNENLKRVTVKLLNLQKELSPADHAALKVEQVLTKLDQFAFPILYQQQDNQLFTYLSKGTNINKLKGKVTDENERVDLFLKVLSQAEETLKAKLIDQFVNNDESVDWNKHVKKITDLKLIEEIYGKLEKENRQTVVKCYSSVKLFRLERDEQIKMQLFNQLPDADQNQQIQFIKDNYEDHELLDPLIILVKSKKDPAFLRDVLINFKDNNRFDDALKMIGAVRKFYDGGWLDAQSAIIIHYRDQGASVTYNKAFEIGKKYLDSYDLVYLKNKGTVYQDLLRSLADAQKEWQSVVLLDKGARKVGRVAANVAKYFADHLPNYAMLSTLLYRTGWLGGVGALYASISGYAKIELGAQAALVAMDSNSLSDPSETMSRNCGNHFSSYEALCNQWYEEGQNAQYAANLVANIGLAYKVLEVGAVTVPVLAYTIHRYVTIPLDEQRYLQEFNKRIMAS